MAAVESLSPKTSRSTSTSRRDKRSYFYLNVDGLEKADAIKRAFWFRTTFRQEGNRQPVTEDKTPRVRFEAERSGFPRVRRRSFTSNSRSTTHRSTPNSRSNCFAKTEDRILAEWNVPWTAPAKDRRLGFDIKSDSGTLWFEASEKDWVQDFKVNGVLDRACSKRGWSMRPARTSSIRIGK